MAGVPMTLPKLLGAQDVSAPSKAKALKSHIFKALDGNPIAKKFIGQALLLSIVDRIHAEELDKTKFDHFVANELDTTMLYLQGRFSEKMDEDQLVKEFLENFNEYEFQEYKVQSDPMGGAALGLSAPPGFGSVFGGPPFGGAFYGNAAAYGGMGFPSTSGLGGAYATPSVNPFGQPVKTEPTEGLSSGGITPSSSVLGTPTAVEPQDTLMKTTFMKRQNDPNRPHGLLYPDIRVFLTPDDEMAKLYIKQEELQRQKKNLKADKQVEMSAELIALKAQIEGNEKNYRLAVEAKQSNQHHHTHAKNKKNEAEAKLDKLKKQQAELEADIKKTTQALKDYTRDADMYGGKVAGLIAAFEAAKKIVEGPEHTQGQNKLERMLKAHQAAEKRFNTNDQKKKLDQEEITTLTTMWNLKVHIATAVQGKYPNTPSNYFTFHFYMKNQSSSWMVNLKNGCISVPNSSRPNAGNWQCAPWKYWVEMLPMNERNVAEYKQKPSEILEGGDLEKDEEVETPREDQADQPDQAGQADKAENLPSGATTPGAAAKSDEDMEPATDPNKTNSDGSSSSDDSDSDDDHPAKGKKSKVAPAKKKTTRVQKGQSARGKKKAKQNSDDSDLSDDSKPLKQKAKNDKKKGASAANKATAAKRKRVLSDNEEEEGPKSAEKEEQGPKSAEKPKKKRGRT